MFAVIKTGGKQYKVAKDQVLAVERLIGEPGETVTFESVLMLGEGDQVTTGAPFVAGASVTAEVLRAKRGPKIIVFKKKRRKTHRRRNGHRQDLTELRIGEILTEGQTPAAKPQAAPKPAEEEAPAAEAEEVVAAEAEAVPAPEASEPEAVASAPEPEAVASTPEPEASEPEASEPEVVATAPATLEAPEGEADDLKQITGVGPQLEKKLNELGIYHFRQIAALSLEETHWVEEQLKIGGRMESDDWIGQAKALAEASEE